MLVLDRKIGELVLINQGTIQVKVLKVDNGIITMGFHAPADVDIDREEIFFRKKVNQLGHVKKF